MSLEPDPGWTSFTVSVDESGGAAVISPEGEFDGVGVSEFDRVVAEVSGRATSVVVDLAATRFLDAAALGALVRASATITAVGGRVALRHPSAAVERLLEITQLTSFLRVEP